MIPDPKVAAAIVAPTAPLPPRHDGHGISGALLALNTHFVGHTGFATGLLASTLTVARALADAGHFPGGAVVKISLDTLDSYLGLPAMFLGLGAAYVGRPGTVAPYDAKQVAIADLEGTPRPVTPAAP